MTKAKSKPKKLTQREKNFRASVRKEMKEKGVLPPDKPRLNRKKFAQETMAAFKDFKLDDAVYLYYAITASIPDGTESWQKISSEDVGALKVIATAIAWKRFEAERRAAGQKDGYSVGELIDNVLKPIRKL